MKQRLASFRANVRRARRVIGAFLYIGYLNSRSYPALYLLRILRALVPIVTFFFVARLIEVDADRVGGDYHTFVVLGLIAGDLLATTLRAVSDELESAIKQGQLEALLTQPVSWRIIPYGLAMWPILMRLMTALAMIVLGLALGMEIRLDGLPESAVILTLGASATLGVGVLAASIKVLAKRVDPVITLYSVAAPILAGVFFSIDLLPPWIRWMSYLIPDTYVISAIRELLMLDPGEIVGPGARVAVIALTIFNLIIHPIAIRSFMRALDFGRQVGVLAGY